MGNFSTVSKVSSKSSTTSYNEFPRWDDVIKKQSHNETSNLMDRAPLLYTGVRESQGSHSTTPSENQVFKNDSDWQLIPKFGQETLKENSDSHRPAGGGRQRSLTALEKVIARSARDTKACWACHLSKTKVCLTGKSSY